MVLTNIEGRVTTKKSVTPRSTCTWVLTPYMNVLSVVFHRLVVGRGNGIGDAALVVVSVVVLIRVEVVSGLFKF